MRKRLVEWDDVAHFVCFNLVLLVIPSVILGWEFSIFLTGWALWDLGWHQRQHHRNRAHIHLTFRILGFAGLCVGTILLAIRTGHIHR